MDEFNNQQNNYNPTQPNYNNPYENGNMNQPQNDVMAIVSLCVGIASVVLMCCCTYLSVPCGIVGLILGILSIRKNNSQKNMAIAGVILSSIGIVFGIVSFVILVVMYGVDYYSEILYQLENMV